jgi:hypothetical protein
MPVVGIDTAGALLVSAGDNPDRLGSESTFAALCGVAPLPASSGRTQRHRLNRGDDRDANNTLWRIVLVRMRWHEPIRAYVARRTAEELSKAEIMRCLKRYTARGIHRTMEQHRLIQITSTTDEAGQLSSRTPTSRFRCATADRQAQARESHPEAGRAATGTHDAPRPHPRPSARQHGQL